MSSSLKISADTSSVKKSILDIGKSIKDLKGSKVTIFSPEDKKFIKGEMTKEIALMKNKLKENRDLIADAVKEQQGMVAGTKEELALRQKILEAYKVQAKLGKDLGSTQKSHGSTDSSGGGMMSGIMGFMKMIPGLAAVATIGYAVTKGKQANDQYVAGSGSRNKLKGLGVSDENFGSPEALARVGLTEQDMVQRRVDATATLGRNGSSQAGEMRKAGFERSFGLEGGTMTGIAGQLRGQMGGEGANDAQMKLQASVFASGIEDAIGPYLESATQLLSSINENGSTQTTEIMGMLAQLTKDGKWTPEMISKTFSGMNESVKGATGEQSAFLQNAYAKAGIGGGSIGGTKFAMSSGGIMGLNEGELRKKGYNEEMLGQMKGSGMFKGASDRVGAISDQIRASGGMKPGENFKDVKSLDQKIGVGNLASKTLGIKDPELAYQALMMGDDVKNGKMKPEEFQKKMKSIQEQDADPSIARLDKINGTLSGQTEYLKKINTNLMEALGKQAVQVGNEITKTDNQGVIGATNVAGAVNSSGFTAGAGKFSEGIGKAGNSGGMGGALYDNSPDGLITKAKVENMTSEAGVVEMAKKRRDQGKGFVGMDDNQIEQKIHATLNKVLNPKEIGKEMAKGFKDVQINNTNINKVQVLDGSITDRVGK